MGDGLALADAASWTQAVSGTLAVIITVLTGVISWRQGRRTARRQSEALMREAEERRRVKQREQAEKVWAMWGNNPADAGDTEPGMWGAVVGNDSDAPVTFVNVTVRHRRSGWVSKDDRDTVAGHSKDKWAAPKVYANVHGGLGVPALGGDEKQLREAWEQRNVHLIDLLFRDQGEQFWRYDEQRRLHQLNSELVIWADHERLPTVREHIHDEFVPKLGISPTFEPYPTTEDLQDRFNELAGAPPAGASVPDILVAPHDWVGSLVANDAVEEIQLSTDQRNAFYPQALDALSSDGRLFGIPYAFDTVALISNLALTGDTPAPATFTELLAHGEEVCARHGLEIPVALQVGGRGDPYHLWPLFASAGGTLAGLPGSVGDAAPRDEWLDGLVEAFTEIGKLGADAKSGRPLLSPQLDRDGAEALFLNGQTPYLIGACSRLGKVLRRGMAIGTAPVPPLGVRPAQTLVTVLGFYLSPSGNNLHIARDIVSYYLARRDAAIELNLINPWPPVQRAATEVVKAQTPQLSAYIEACHNGVLMPKLPHMRGVWDALGRAQVRAMRGDGTARTIAAEFADAAEVLLRR